jgi:hypothetical protein
MSTDPPKAKSTIENTLFGFVISLTLKAALDTAYGHTVPSVASGKELWQALDVPASLLVIVFLATLLRFVFGAYRFHEECQEPAITLKSAARLWNVAATLVLFIFFYLTGLSIQHTQPFSVGLISVHVWDIIWFVIILVTDTFPNNLRKVMLKFVIIDSITIALILILNLLFPAGYRTQLAIGMIILAIADVAWNRTFLLQPAKWRDSN